MGFAEFAGWAIAAMRPRGVTPGRSQLHERLSQRVAGPTQRPAEALGQGHPLGGDALDFRLSNGGIHTVVDGFDAGDDPGHVAINRGVWAIERNAENRARCVGTDSRERPKRLQGAGKPSGMAVDDLLGGSFEIAGSGVVAEARPEFEETRLADLREVEHARKLAHPPFPVGDHRRDLRLL